MPIIYVRKTVSDDFISQLAGSFEGKVQQAFLAAVKATKGTVSEKALEEAISKGSANDVMAILALDTKFVAALQGARLSMGVTSFRDALQSVFAAAAKAAMKRLPESVSTEMSFNLLNPKAVSFLESYEFRLIQQITNDTKEGIRQTILNAFKEGGSPAEQAREIRNMIGLTGNQQRAVQNYRDALESGGTSDLRDALSRALRDGRYDRSLLSAIENQTGLDAGRIDTMVARYQERFLNYRATNIARTETIRASNSGQRELWRQATEQGFLKGAKRVWITADDDRTCDVCDDLDEEEAGMDEEFAPGIMEPPDPHPSCRCSVALSFK